MAFHLAPDLSRERLQVQDADSLFALLMRIGPVWRGRPIAALHYACCAARPSGRGNPAGLARSPPARLS